MDTGLPQHIRQFLVDCIESVSQLELLFLFYSNPQKQWTSDTISRELRTHPTTALKQAQFLHQKGILKQEDINLFSYSPSDEHIHQIITELNDLYHVRPVAIVTFMYKSPTEKLKGFADAFKFKKD